MTDIFLLTTSAAWRKLNCVCANTIQWQKAGQNSAQLHAVNYLSIAPYSTADASHHLVEVADKDAFAACSLSLYRGSLLYAYKHILNQDFQQAQEECNQAITYLQEGLNRLGIATELDQNAVKARARCFVNSLASQAELQQARTTNKIAHRLVIVLGMHRSGTSALTGMLAKAGFTAPSDLIQADDANPKGYWESLSINKLNEDFLEEMESHWSSSIPLPTGWSESISARKWRSSLIDIISETFGGAELPTIKDPRFCILITGLEPWLESRLIDTSFFIPIRHPLEVSNSLLQAQGTDLEKTLRLWIRSILLAEQATRGHRRKFISFDLLLQDPTNTLKACLQLVQSAADPETAGNMANWQDKTKSETLSHATSFIETSLKRQQPVIHEKDSLEVNTICNTKLIGIAETVFHAIIANITDDQAISKALDELRLNMTCATM
jgi:hypothetical protein